MRFDDEGDYGSQVHLIGWKHRKWIGECICMESSGGPLIYRPSEQRYVREGCDFSMSFRCALHLMFKDLKTLLNLHRRRAARKCLAVAMGLHKRLGAASQLALLDCDLIQKICAD